MLHPEIRVLLERQLAVVDLLERRVGGVNLLVGGKRSLIASGQDFLAEPRKTAPDAASSRTDAGFLTSYLASIFRFAKAQASCKIA